MFVKAPERPAVARLSAERELIRSHVREYRRLVGVAGHAEAVCQLVQDYKQEYRELIRRLAT